MKELVDFVKAVRVLKVQCPVSVIVLPPLNRGLPSGCWNLDDLLETIALNLEGKRPLCRT